MTFTAHQLKAHQQRKPTQNIRILKYLRKQERLIVLFTKATASQIDIIEGMSNVICKVNLPTTHYSHLSWDTSHNIRFLFQAKICVIVMFVVIRFVFIPYQCMYIPAAEVYGWDNANSRFNQIKIDKKKLLCVYIPSFEAVCYGGKNASFIHKSNFNFKMKFVSVCKI